MVEFKLRRRELLKVAAAGAALTAMPPLKAFAQSAPAVLRGTPKGEVVIWNFQGTKGEDDWQMPFFTQFEKDTGYTVKVLLRPWDKQREDLLAGMAGGQLPDIFKGHSKLVGEFGEAGVLQPLDELDGWAEYSSQFVPEFINQLNYKNRPYGVPYSTGAFILIGNKKLMQASGIESPRTFEDFKAAAIAGTGKVPGVYGFVAPGGANADSAFRFVGWLYKAGGRVLDEEWTRPMFHEDAGVAALDLWVQTLQAGAMPPGVPAYAFNDAAQYWGLEKAVFASEGNWWQHLMETGYNMPADNLVLSPLPAPSSPIGGAPSVTLSDLLMYGMCKDGPNPLGAWELLKYARSSKADLAFATEGGQGIPVTKASYEPDVNWKLYGKDVFLSEAPGSITWPNHPHITEIQIKLGEAINAALSGSMSAKDALAAAAADTLDILG